MKITYQLAQQIVEHAIKILGININIMNKNGIIVGSGDKNRLNKFHEGVAFVL